MGARATWFCVDIECSGPVPALYDLLSLGIVVVDGTDLRIGDQGYWEVAPTAPRVDPGAMKVNGLDLERLRRDGIPMRRMLDELSAFVAAKTAPGAKPVFVGHNAPFDWSFVSYAYHAEGLANPFGYKALDTKALAMGVLGLHWFDTNKEELERLLQLPAQDAARTHRADYDAWYQAHILVGLLRRLPPRVHAPGAR
jgi:DNA polymerase III epsilon subunit-like protein